VTVLISICCWAYHHHQSFISGRSP